MLYQLSYTRKCFQANKMTYAPESLGPVLHEPPSDRRRRLRQERTS